MTRLPIAGRLALAGAALAAAPAIAAAAPSAPALDAPPGFAPGPGLQVSWSAATFDPLASGQRYTVSVARVDGAVETPVAAIDVAAPALQATVPGLVDATYRFRVVASELPCLDPPSDPPAASCTTQATDPDGRVTGPASAPADVRIDGAAPTASIALNGGAQWANDPAVSTGLVAADPSPMRMVLGSAAGDVTCDILLCGTPFAADPVFTLPDGDGPKTVFARVVDAAGNGRTVSDTIGLDTTPPDLWATASALEIDAGQTVDFSTKEATDAGSGIVESSFAWSFCAACAPTASGRNATRTFDEPGQFLVTLKATDVAGNVGGDSFFLTVDSPSSGGPPPGPATPAAPASPSGPAGSGGPARSSGSHTLLSEVALVGTPRVGVRVAVRVTLSRKAKVVFDVLDRPGAKQTLLARFTSRGKLRKGRTVYRLPAPSRAATRVLRVRAGSDVWMLPLRIHPAR